jgi:predicted acyltransferase
VRSLSLIIIGVLMVNAEQGNAPGVMSPDAWNTLMTIAVLLAWQAPTDRIRRWRPAMIALGVLALVGLAFLYRSTDATGVIQLRPQWWGILGLIGWSYLVASVIYLAAGDRPPVLIGATALLYGLFFADAFGLIPTVPYVHVGSTLGSHAALVVSGAVITAWFARYRTGRGSAGPFAWYALAYGAALIAAGWVVHQFRDLDPAFWISKPHATPAWCLISGGITCTAWAILYELADVKDWRHWPSTITIAGQTALVAYLLAPMLSSLFALSSVLTGGVNLYGALGDHLLVGTIRSALFAWLVVWICGRLRAAGIQARL